MDGSIIRLLVLNAQQLVEIPVNRWRGNLLKQFPGFDSRINCFQNEKHGSSFLTGITVSNCVRYDCVDFVYPVDWLDLGKQVTLGDF